MIKSEIRLIEQKFLPVKDSKFKNDNLEDWGVESRKFYRLSTINNSVRYIGDTGSTLEERSLTQSIPFEYDYISTIPFENAKAVRVDYKVIGLEEGGSYTIVLGGASGTTRTESGDYFDTFYLTNLTTTTTTTPPPTTTTTTTLSGTTTTTTTTIPPSSGTTEKSISTVLGSSIILNEDGTICSFGRNDRGQLGHGTFNHPIITNVSIPTPIITNTFFNKIGDTNITKHFTSIDNNGQAWAWGDNDYGKLGDNTYTWKATPVAVCGGHIFCHIVSGGGHSLGIDNNGQAWGWGYNGDGQLGNNSRVSGTSSILVHIPSTPVAVCGGHTFCKIAAGGSNSLGIDNNGQAWAWGDNDYGKLGDNTTICRSTPVAVCGGHTFCHISGGNNHSLGIDNNGQAWAWGNNYLGNNTTLNRRTPVAVCGGHTFCDISSGLNHLLAIDHTGKAWAWGGNSFGQIGDNTTTSRLTPVAVCGGHTFCDISASNYYSLAMDLSGQTWGWGDNQWGQLGNNSTTINMSGISTPVAVSPCNT